MSLEKGKKSLSKTPFQPDRVSFLHFQIVFGFPDKAFHVEVPRGTIVHKNITYIKNYAANYFSRLVTITIT